MMAEPFAVETNPDGNIIPPKSQTTGKITDNKGIFKEARKGFLAARARAIYTRHH